MDDSDEIEMVGECTDSYIVEEKPDGIRIIIDVPARFKSLWLIKLTDLMTNKKEIDGYSDDNQT